MLSASAYLIAALQVAAVLAALAWSAYRLRARLLPGWRGAPARLVEAVVVVALLTWQVELLGLFGLLYAGTLIALSALVAGATALLSGGGAAGGAVREETLSTATRGGGTAATGPAGRGAAPAPMTLVTVAVVALVVAHWGVTTKHALDAGIFNFDSLWYHMPFSVEMAKGHSLTAMHQVDTVFTNWFYPQGSELLHGVGILLTGRDTLSLFLNFGWLAVAFLAAWCIGRPSGRGQLCVVAAALLLECHTLVVREPGAAKNDLMAAALLLAAIAILVEARGRRRAPGGPDAGSSGAVRQAQASAWDPGWEMVAAGLAVGLAVGTKQTALAMAAALTVAAIALAPAGRRWAALAWWGVPAVAAGGFWYLRDLFAAGNPIPQVHGIGPIPLPHPEQLQSGRPDFSVAHYATDPGVWRHYFAPGLETAFGALWPLVLAACVLGAALAVARGGRVLRWVGAVALFGMLAYLFTPLSAAGAEGAPAGFGINIRYAIPALLVGIVLLPTARAFDSRRTQWLLLAFLVALIVVSNRPDEILRDQARVFAVGLAALAVLLPSALLAVRGRGASRLLVGIGCGALVLCVVAGGYPLQRDYLQSRFANPAAKEGIPGMNLDSAYRWARDVEGARIGLVGTSAGFAGYGFYGTDLSNQVTYLGKKGPHGAFNAIPTCAAFREAVNRAELDFLVTAPFLNFIHVSEPIPSPESRWLRGEEAVEPLLRSGPVTVWRVTGSLDPAGCEARNAPLREIPMTPSR